jgi:hypothetical protein
MFLPRTTRFCSALLLCFAVAPLGAQPGDGFVVRERAGVAFVKPQPWSKESEATMVEFQAFINRTADGGSVAGYYEFRTKTANRRQIPIARIVKLVIYPDIREFADIAQPEDRRVLISAIEELKSVTARFPSSRTRLEPFIGQLSGELARYDSGEVKCEGVWIPRETYVKRLAIKLASLLKADIARARPPSSLNLEDDPKFVGLREMGETNPDAKRLATEVSTNFEQLVRAEKRGDLLIKLDRPGTSLAEAREAVQQLKALRPGEDARTAALVNAWDFGVAFVEATSAESETIAAQIERELASFKPGDGLPDISPELEQRISALNGRITSYLATKPPKQLSGAIEKAAAVCRVEAVFKRLKTIVAEKQYIEAKDLLDDLAPWAVLIGPQTTRVVGGLQRKAVEKIEQFTRLRAEGKLLAESGKKGEALEKFEAALAVIPDSEIGQQVSQLKQEVSDISSKAQ